MTKSKSKYSKAPIYVVARYDFEFIRKLHTDVIESFATIFDTESPTFTIHCDIDDKPFKGNFEELEQAITSSRVFYFKHAKFSLKGGCFISVDIEKGKIFIKSDDPRHFKRIRAEIIKRLNYISSQQQPMNIVKAPTQSVPDSSSAVNEAFRGNSPTHPILLQVSGNLIINNGDNSVIGTNNRVETNSTVKDSNIKVKNQAEVPSNAKEIQPNSKFSDFMKGVWQNIVANKVEWLIGLFTSG